MGVVIPFPEQRRAAWSSISVPIESVDAPVVILPVIRIERYADDIDIGFTPEEDGPATAGGGSRRRSGRRS